MGFLRKLFNKSINDSIDHQRTLDDKKNLSDDSFIKKLDKSIAEMDENEKERMVDSIARGESFANEDGTFNTDPMLIEAARFIVQYQQGSTSLIQRKLAIGYSRSGRIMDQLEELGIVGPFDGSNPRNVNFQSLTELERYFNSNPSLSGKTQLFYRKYKDIIDQRRSEYLKNLELENDRLEKEEIKKQMIEKERKKRLHKEALKELIESGEIFNTYTDNDGKREPIPQEVMDKVWNRDGGKCVKCGSQENLEFDHIIPVSKGGATTYKNIQLLCKKCNLDKSNKIG